MIDGEAIRRAARNRNLHTATEQKDFDRKSAVAPSVAKTENMTFWQRQNMVSSRSEKAIKAGELNSALLKNQALAKPEPEVADLTKTETAIRRQVTRTRFDGDVAEAFRDAQKEKKKLDEQNGGRIDHQPRIKNSVGQEILPPPNID